MTTTGRYANYALHSCFRSVGYMVAFAVVVAAGGTVDVEVEVVFEVVLVPYVHCTFADAVVGVTDDVGAVAEA